MPLTYNTSTDDGIMHRLLALNQAWFPLNKKQSYEAIHAARMWKEIYCQACGFSFAHTTDDADRAAAGAALVADAAVRLLLDHARQPAAATTTPPSEPA